MAENSFVKSAKLAADNAPAALKVVATKIPWLWVKDDSGRKSVTVTLVIVSFLVTTVAYILSIVGSIGAIEFRQFDVAACAAYLAPILALYFGRKRSVEKNNDVRDASHDATLDDVEKTDEKQG